MKVFVHLNFGYYVMFHSSTPEAASACQGLRQPRCCANDHGEDSIRCYQNSLASLPCIRIAGIL